MFGWLAKKVAGISGTALFDNALTRMQQLSRGEQESAAALINHELNSEKKLLRRPQHLNHVGSRDSDLYQTLMGDQYQDRLTFHQFRMDRGRAENDQVAYIVSTLWFSVYTALRGGDAETAAVLLKKMEDWIANNSAHA
jgi:hypothetical protein